MNKCEEEEEADKMWEGWGLQWEDWAGTIQRLVL